MFCRSEFYSFFYRFKVGLLPIISLKWMTTVQVQVKVVMAARCGFYSALLFYGFLQYFYMKHVSFNINYEGDWTSDRFDVFLTKINTAERSVFYVECLSKLTQRTVMAKWRSFETCKTSTRNNYFLILALLLSGDISLNPGPVKYPCIGCKKPVKSNQQAIQCDFCDQWIHRKCTNPLMAEPDYKRLGQSTDNYYCYNCIHRLPILSDSFFNYSDIDDETFSTTSSMNNSVFRIRPCGTIFSNVDFSQCRLSASNVKFPQMYLRDLVFDTVNGLLWYVLISNSAEKATSSGKVLS